MFNLRHPIQPKTGIYIKIAGCKSIEGGYKKKKPKNLKNTGLYCLLCRRERVSGKLYW